MSKEELRKLAVSWAVMAEYYGRPISDLVAQMYAADLIDLAHEDVHVAMTRMRREPKRRNLFLPADVREYINGPSGGAPAVELAARIGGCVSRYGYTNRKLAEAHIGPVGWSVVVELGGWQHLCSTLNAKDMHTFHAQCRELCKAALVRAPARDGDRPALPGRGQPQLGRVQQMIAGIG